MSDSAIKSALSKKVEAEDRVKKLERGIRKAKDTILEINKFIAQWEKFSGKSASLLNDANSQKSADDVLVPVNGMHGRMVPANPRKEEVAEAARVILQEFGRSLSRDELYREITKRGIKIVGKKPEMILSTMLWRTQDNSGIHRLKSGGYYLAGNADPDDVDTSDEDLLEDGEE